MYSAALFPIFPRFVFLCQLQASCNLIRRLRSTHSMMTSSNGNIFRATGPLCGEFSGWPVNSPHKGQWRGALMFSLICTRINGWVKQWWGWWFETPSCPLWRHCNALQAYLFKSGNLSDTWHGYYLDIVSIILNRSQCRPGNYLNFNCMWTD